MGLRVKIPHEWTHLANKQLSRLILSFSVPKRFLGRTGKEKGLNYGGFASLDEGRKLFPPIFFRSKDGEWN